jgi:hypothetical protein
MCTYNVRECNTTFKSNIKFQMDMVVICKDFNIAIFLN